MKEIIGRKIAEGGRPEIYEWQEQALQELENLSFRKTKAKFG